MEDWALIRRLVADGVSQRQVARDLGIDRGTVARAVGAQIPPKYERKSQVVTLFDGVEAQVRQLLSQTPTMPASVLAERVGWQFSSSGFRKNVARIRPEYLPVDPADRLTWMAGDVAQCDLWFPSVEIPLADGVTRSLPVLVMVSAFSRFTMAIMLPSRQTPDLLLGMWQLINQLGRVPRRLMWDNEAGIGRFGRLAAGVEAFTGSLATRLVQLKPYDPESKGLVERRNGWLETSFLPGREFSSPDDFNAQLVNWLSLANRRKVRTIKAAPVDRLGEDLAAMLPLPTIPLHLGWRSRIRLGRDYYVAVAGSQYSVCPTAIGAMVDITADLERVKIRAGGRLVADHARSWISGQQLTDPAHVQAAARLRRQYQTRQQTKVTATSDDLLRDLADYDRAFGTEAI